MVESSSAHSPPAADKLSLDRRACDPAHHSASVSLVQSTHTCVFHQHFVETMREKEDSGQN